MLKRCRTPALAIAVSAALITACSGSVDVSEEEKRAGERAAKRSNGAESIFSGTLEGKSGHEMSGTVSLRQSGNNYILEFGDDFAFDGAPAPVVAFGKEGYRKETRIGALRQNKGKHAYEIPSTIETRKLDEVWVWCTDYDVPLGKANLVGK